MGYHLCHLQWRQCYRYFVRQRPGKCRVNVSEYQPAQLELEGVIAQPDVEAIVAKTTNLVIQEMIDIPRILVLPTGEVKSGFRPFTLELASLNYPPPSDELWIQHLRTNQLEIIGLQKGGIDESRLEDV